MQIGSMVSDTGNIITCLRGWLCACLLLCWLPVTQAVDELHFSMESMAGEGWELGGLEVDLTLVDDAFASAAATVGALQIAGETLEKLQLRCPTMELGDVLSCADGSLEIAGSPFGPVAGRLAWRYFDAGHWQLKLKAMRFSRARLLLDLDLTGKRLQIGFNLQDFSLPLLAKYFPKGWALAGNVNIQGGLTLEEAAVTSVQVEASLNGFSYSSEDGLQVGEDLSLRLDVDASKTKDVWQGRMAARLLQGQLYADPFFLEIDEEKPVKLHLQGKLSGDGERLELRRLSADLGAALSLQGEADVDLAAGRLPKLNLHFRAADLGQVYGMMLQPLVIGSALDDLDVSGRMQGELRIVANEPQALSLVLQQAHVEQKSGQFGLSGVEADIQWRRSGAPQTSRLRWNKGHLYKIAFGALDAVFSARAGEVILQPLSLPVLDGRLQLEDFRLGGLLDGELHWQARAELKDIRLGALSQALDWPRLDGSLQASIPRLHYRDAMLGMDGELLVDVFGGRLVVEGLKLEDPLGVAPVLETSVRLHDLDLEQITQAFDFGRIEGSLEGYIRNLQLVAWQVTGFDASLRSPARDRRRHRISQRAIDNLTELGNGASANLSATMLRFFEDFAYERLALKVHLRGAMAELDGVSNPAGGYYIVKGAGLPRIDVIGRNHKVAWKDLLSRIRDIRFDDMIVE
ncbi:hypothetical protein [Thiolapillus sp.]